MRAPIRAVFFASALALAVAAPVLADSPTRSHVSLSSCWTDEVAGRTYCSATETDLWIKEFKSGETMVKMDSWFLATSADLAGNLVTSFESWSREHDTVFVEGGGPVFTDINTKREDEVIEGGVTSCTRYRVLIKNEIERINKVATSPGAC